MLSQYNSKTLDEGGYVINCAKTIKLEKEYNLKAAQALLLSEISIHLSENESLNIVMNKKSDMICDVLCKNTAFLPNSDVMNIFQQEEKKKTENNCLKRKILPSRMLQFWKDIIFLLHRNEMLETLVFKLLDIVHQEHETKERRTFSALWISSIIYSFVQLDIAQNICRSAEHTLKKLDTKTVSQYVREDLRSNYPYLQDVLWLDISSIIPDFLMDINFLSKLLLHANEFSKRLIEPIFKFVMPKISPQMKKHLSYLLKNYTSLHTPKNKDINIDVHDKIYTIEDLQTGSIKDEQIHMKKNTDRKETTDLADQVIRNLHWKPALGMFM